MASFSQPLLPIINITLYYSTPYTPIEPYWSLFALEYVEYIDTLPSAEILPSLVLVSQRKAPIITMPTSRGGKQTVTPVIVEVKPSNVGGSNIAPSSPPGSPGSRKARFARNDSGLVTGVSRPLSQPEAWSLYHFETHARLCDECHDPLKVHLRGKRLCNNGLALAQDVAEHVYHHGGEAYSRRTDDYHKHVRVEIPHGYNQIRLLLQAMDRELRSSKRTVPIISYDPTYPIPARRRSPSPERRRKRYEDERKDVIIEPAISGTRRSAQRPKRYSKVVLNEDVEAGPPRQPGKKPDARRGSLYEKDKQRQDVDRGYVVEVREPEQRDRDRERKRYREEQRRKEERRRSQGFWI